jgi:hypothetical protein
MMALLRFVLPVEAMDRDTFTTQPHQHRVLQPAGGAPGGVDVDQHRLAAQVGRREALSSPGRTGGRLNAGTGLPISIDGSFVGSRCSPRKNTPIR